MNACHKQALHPSKRRAILKIFHFPGIKKSSKFAFPNVSNVAKILYFVTEQRLYNWFCLSNVKLDDFTYNLEDYIQNVYGKLQNEKLYLLCNMQTLWQELCW